MAMGLLRLGDEHLSQAKQAMQQSAQLAQQRGDFNRAAKESGKLGVISNVAQGAGMGASLGGPWGAAAGAGLGLLASFL